MCATSGTCVWNFLLSLSSEKLGVNATTVQHGVQGMMYLLTECSKLMVCGIHGGKCYMHIHVHVQPYRGLYM